MQKNLLDFGDLDLIFTGDQKMLIIALSALYLLKESMDFNQTCMDISLGGA